MDKLVTVAHRAALGRNGFLVLLSSHHLYMETPNPSSTGVENTEERRPWMS